MASNSSTSDQPSAAPAKPFQFSLRQMLVWTLVLSAALALVSQLGGVGIGLAIIALSIWVIAGGGYRHRASLGLCLVGFWLGGCLSVWHGIATGPHDSRQSSCNNHLKFITLALHAYHDRYNSFPPAYVADASGKPMHSWRVLILPYMEYKGLYDRYDFNEPWDGPNNRLLLKEMPREFRCPCQPLTAGGMPTETNYVAVVGPHTVWPGDKTRTLDQITDGTSSTLLVVEVHDSGISWLEPRDLHISQMPLTINPTRGQGISSRHGAARDKDRGDRAIGAFCDGHVEALRNDLPRDTLRAILTADGDEDLRQDAYWNC